MLERIERRFRLCDGMPVSESEDSPTGTSTAGGASLTSLGMTGLVWSAMNSDCSCNRSIGGLIWMKG